MPSILSSARIKTLLVNLVVASLPVLTYVAADSILNHETRRPKTETEVTAAAADSSKESRHGDKSTDGKDGPDRESRIARDKWLKLDTIETTQRASRLARPSELVSNGPDHGPPASDGLFGRSVILRTVRDGPVRARQPLLVRLASAIAAHAPPSSACLTPAEPFLRIL